MTSGTPPTAASVQSLSDPVRDRLYHYVADQDAPVSRDRAARAAGISRTLAAYHLDRLAEAGLVTVTYARPGNRTGPGAGRPAKLYARAHDEISVTIPPRNYRLLARLLAAAAAADESGAVRAALARAAHDEGIALAEQSSGVWESLQEAGYEPRTVDDVVALRNCPFHQVAQHQTELVCGMNHGLVRGILAGCGEDAGRAELAPGEDRCCVLVHPAPPSL